jgi:predicted nucleic acid-binding protein
MSAKLTTFDTTILFYALDRDGDSRTARARRLVELAPTANTVLMLQSLTELWSAVTHKRPEQRGRARDIVDELMTTFPVVAANQEDFTQALGCGESRRLQHAAHGRFSGWPYAGRRYISQSVQDDRRGRRCPVRVVRFRTRSVRCSVRTLRRRRRAGCVLRCVRA